MKKILFICGVMTLSASLQGYGQTKNGFTLAVNVPKTADGRKAYLKAEDAPGKSIDSAVVKNGTFTFTGSVAYPQLYTVVFKKQPEQRFASVIPVFVENSKIAVTAGLDTNATELELLYSGGYPYDKIKVTGSAAHALFLKYAANYEPLKAIQSKAFDAYINYLNPGKGKEKAPISVGIKLVEQIDVPN